MLVIQFRFHFEDISLQRKFIKRENELYQSSTTIITIYYKWRLLFTEISKTFLIFFVYVPDLKLFKSPCGLSPDDGFETMVPGGIASDSMLPMEGTPSINESCNIGLTFLRVYKANFLINVLIAVPKLKYNF